MKRIPAVMMSLAFLLSSLSAQVVGGIGTTNYIPVWTGSTTIGNSIMYQTDSQIGINTNSPQYALDVSGAPPEKQIEWARHPQMMKKIQQVRQAQHRASLASGVVPASASAMPK